MALLIGLRLPEEVERGAIGGSRFNTSVLSLDSGFEVRNENWVDSLGEWDAGYGLLLKHQSDPASAQLDLDRLINIFHVARGRAHSFRFKDWADFEIAYQLGSTTGISPQFLANGDGTTTIFQVFKRYTVPGVTDVFDRFITKIVNNSTLVILLDDVVQTETTHYTVDYDRGLITMVSTPGGPGSGGNGPGGENQLTVRAEFDAHVRFDVDDLKASVETFNAGSWPSFPLLELRENGLD